MKIVLTAGFNNSKSAYAIGESLRKKGADIKAVAIVSPFSFTRIKHTLVKNNFFDIVKLIKKLLNKRQISSSEKFFYQYNDLQFSSLKAWAHKHGIRVLEVKNINEKKFEHFLIKNSIDSIIYGGGGILRNNIIESVAGRIINFHSGPLPEIRGMNAIEWSLLLEKELCSTIHLIDKGIDTGRVISRVSLDISGIDTIDDLKDAAFYQCLQYFLDNYQINSLGKLFKLIFNRPPIIQNNIERQCFKMSRVMLALTQHKLDELNENNKEAN